MTRFRILALAALVGLAAAPARGQVCNGLPFRGRGIVAASYLRGDAADNPYSVHEYGGMVVRQLGGWSPLGTHQAVRLEGAGGSASIDYRAPDTGLPLHYTGKGGSGGAAYTLDVLPASYAGDYVVCLSGGVQGQWWKVGGSVSHEVLVPAWLSFGAPLRAGIVGVFPHASFGGYWRGVGGYSPQGSIRTRGFRPWSEAGAGIFLGPARVDAVLRHEFRTRERLVLTAGFAR